MNEVPSVRFVKSYKIFSKIKILGFWVFLFENAPICQMIVVNIGYKEINEENLQKTFFLRKKNSCGDV